MADLDPVRFADVAHGQVGAVLEHAAVDRHAENTGQLGGPAGVRVVGQPAGQDLHRVGNAESELRGGVAYVR